MEKYDISLTRNGDRFLILGRCGEDGIIGGAIAKHWKNIKTYIYPNNIYYYLSEIYELDDNTKFGPKQIRKPGLIYITIGGCRISSGYVRKEEIPISDYDRYDYILSVESTNSGGFTPFIFYKEEYKVYFHWFILNHFNLVNDIINEIKVILYKIHYQHYITN